MQAGNKEFCLRRFRYLFLLYAFLSSFVSTIDFLLRVSTNTLVDFKRVTESGAFLAISYLGIALDFCLWLLVENLCGWRGDFVGRSLQSQTSYMYGYYQHLNIWTFLNSLNFSVNPHFQSCWSIIKVALLTAINRRSHIISNCSWNFTKKEDKQCSMPVPVAARSRRRSAASRLLRLWVRIPRGAWKFVCCECCVLSGRGLCDELITRPGESYRLWYVVVCDLQNLVNEEALAHWGGGLLHKKNNAWRNIIARSHNLFAVKTQKCIFMCVSSTTCPCQLYISNECCTIMFYGKHLSPIAK